MAEEYEQEIFTLTDDDGVETDFELIGSVEIDGNMYYALVPLDGNDDNSYVILKGEKDEDGDDIFATIEDDDEFDKVANIFDEELFNEIDYDN